MKFKVIGIGDNVVDKYLHSRMMYPGGNALNFSVYAREYGVESAFLGAFGDDVAARHVQAALNQYQVDWCRCRRYQGENGYACIKLVDGDRIFIESNKGGVLREHPLRLEAEDLAYLSTFDLIHTSLNSYLESQLPLISSLGIPVSFDFSLRGNDDYFRRVCPHVEYGFFSCGGLSENEVNEKIKNIFSYGCKNIIATQGHHSVYYYDGDEMIIYKPEYIKPLDTLGAGDAFLTGFLLSILSCQKHSSYIVSDNKQKVVLAAMDKGYQLARKTLQQYGAFGFGKSF
ncbi:fructoselysine 6-kinase [Pectobacteriaceae bacterium CE70]|nr:fructoselysine 6-kinase [Pectobacteriaceae bacterium C52]WJV68923.1 fructoselysine 6-kinase [Pectobacteriaceae bacterium CE70]